MLNLILMPDHTCFWW